MKNKENSVYVVIALVLISVVASGLLGITNEVTAPVIAMRNKVASDQLRKGVLPIASEFKEMPASKYKGIGGGILKEVYEGEKDGKVAGYTFKVTPSGYGGEIEVMVGITKEGMPLVERVTTITGPCISEPKNLITKIGTKVYELIDQCGGVKDGVTVGKLIMGGPMMGLAQYTDDISTNKGSSGILLLEDKDSRFPEMTNCIRCGRCVDVCPTFLQPLFISAHSLRNNFEMAEAYNAMDCIECGSCSFICPASRPLLPSIRTAKREIGARRRKQAASQKK